MELIEPCARDGSDACDNSGRHVRTTFMILRLLVMFDHAMSAMVKKTKDGRRTGLRRHVTEKEEGKYTREMRIILRMHMADEGKRIIKGRASGLRGYGKAMDARKLI